MQILSHCAGQSTFNLQPLGLGNLPLYILPFCTESPRPLLKAFIQQQWLDLSAPLGNLAQCSPFLFLQGYAMRVTDKGINWDKYSWESHTHQVHALPSKMSNAAFCAYGCEKRSENVAIYPKHIWESRSHSSWATTAGVTGAFIPHDWIQACSALLRHRLEPQIEQSNTSALSESSRMWLSCVTLSWRCLWFVALSETPKNTSSLPYNMPDPASLAR